MGNVLGMEKRQQIQVLTRHGWSDRSVAAELGVYRGTVAKYRELVSTVIEKCTISGHEKRTTSAVVQAACGSPPFSSLPLRR
jgi:IS30 family transposase